MGTLFSSAAEREEKFEELYHAYKGLMFHTANSILHNWQDAEDAVQQAFLSVLKYLDRISDVSSGKTRSLVVIITERKAIDLLRTRKQRESLPINEEFCAPVIPVPDGNGLAEAMARLPARYREVLLLRYDNGYSAREIAGFLDMTAGSVMKLIYRAKKALEKILAEEGMR